MRKKFLSLLLICTMLLSFLVACDVEQNDADPQNQNTSVPTANTQGQSTSDGTADKQPSVGGSLTIGKMSSYYDVIALYKYMVDLFPTYTEEKLFDGQYDGIDAITDEQTKELYATLFSSGYNFYLDKFAYQYQVDGRNCFGYTVTDINKNGSDELILLTDKYEIIAIFSQGVGGPRLLLDNYMAVSELRIDGQGKIYAQRHERGVNSYDTNKLYTEVYLLNAFDNLELLAEYRCDDYRNISERKCYDITKEEKRITEETWTDESHGWVYGSRAGIITKNEAKLGFVRLFGDLHLYLPELYSWDWSSRQFGEYENNLFISNLSDESVNLALYDTYVTYRCIISVAANMDGNIATFETENISGSLEFGSNNVWLIIDKSEILDVPCGAFLYTEINYAKG